MMALAADKMQQLYKRDSEPKPTGTQRAKKGIIKNTKRYQYTVDAGVFGGGRLWS
jgi:hypothetical protein